MKAVKLLVAYSIVAALFFSCGNKETKSEYIEKTTDEANSHSPEVQASVGINAVSESESPKGDGVKSSEPIATASPLRAEDGFLLFSDINGLDKETHIKLKALNVKRFLRLGTRLIDKDADGFFDKESVKNKITGYFPDNNSHGYCVINWEREAFDKLKGRKSKEDFDLATDQYIKLIKYIRTLRPNLKISVYNMPFRENTISSKSKKFDDKTTEKILKEIDFLSPSLYMLYSLNDVTLEKNKDYIGQNLERSFRLANGKPVIPYIGYRIYSNESVDSQKYLSKEEFRIYAEHIKSFKYKGDSVDGFILFNGDHQSFKEKKRSFKAKNISQEQFKKEFNETALDYFTILGSVK